MEPIIGSIFIIFIGLGYLKHIIYKNCTTIEETRNINVLPNNNIGGLNTPPPPKYEEIDNNNPPSYSVI
jgi:hypothetical protein